MKSPKTLVLDIYRDSLDVDAAMMRAGIVDPGISTSDILTFLAIKILAGKTLEQAQNEAVMEIAYKNDLGYDFNELCTIFQGMGADLHRAIRRHGLEYPNSERRWVRRGSNPFKLVLELQS